MSQYGRIIAVLVVGCVPRQSWCQTAGAAAGQVAPEPARAWCFPGAPRHRCHAFPIAQVTLLSTDFYSKRGSYVVALGVLRNGARGHSAVGLSGFLDLPRGLDYGDVGKIGSAGGMLRYRRWLGARASVDAGIGVNLFGDTRGTLASEVSVNLSDMVGVAVRSDGRNVRAGVQLGSYAGAAGIVLTGLAIAGQELARSAYAN